MKEESELGRIEVLPSAIATVIAQALMQCYGVVGLAPHRMTDAVANFFAPDARRSIEIRERPDGLVIDVYLILAHGVRLIAVARSVQHTIKYHVEKIVGLPVAEVNVHIHGLRPQ
ncbi:MAG TPA: Asp23/Gls24 family envelope stress response protein [Thermoflexus sp.]|nr:Asp23/Gls24 family envelope stress response protein [Thermoflexus sp.]